MESLPLIIQSLFGTGLKTVALSAALVALFAELLPQFLVPRRTLQWGYYCSPFIWVCMWMTAVASWPLSWAFDKLTSPQQQRIMYTNEELAALLSLHERREKNGGTIGPDASRIVRGALELDNRTLEKAFLRNEEGSSGDDTIDLEKAGYSRSNVIIPWSAVKHVRISDEITEKFMEEIKGWAYSRIPVIEDDEGAGLNNPKIFGFLHMKVSCFELVYLILY